MSSSSSSSTSTDAVSAAEAWFADNSWLITAIVAGWTLVQTWLIAPSLSRDRSVEGVTKHRFTGMPI
jgi:hypothetical protein